VVARGVVDRRLRSAEILAVGSELLTPFRTDTNSLFLTARLNELGIDVCGKAIVADDPAALQSALRGALDRADVVLTTGGLGPTDDDLTREAIAAVVGVASVEDGTVLAAIAARFASRGMRMPAINGRQAQIPSGATVLPNPRGTAPGLWMPVSDRVIVALPGPPRELEPMFDAEVVPRLQARGSRGVLRRRVLKIAGRGESHVDELAQPVYGPWRDADVPITTTILASSGQVELHLAAQGQDSVTLDRVLAAAVEDMQMALGPIVFSVDGLSLEEVVGQRLRERGLMLAAAESCTGGLLMGALTDVAGSSDWTAGGVVAYSNAVKEQSLGVPGDLIATNGAVSEPVALAMAEGVRLRLGADIGVGITGIAGPGGGTKLKPVGTVVFAVVGPGESRVVRTVRFPGDRAMVRRMAVHTALDLVRRALSDQT
jgi:nicotinamide-nucleotide amidase